MNHNSTHTRLILTRVVPLLLFVSLGLIIVTVTSAGSPSWSQPAQTFGTVPIINGTVAFQGRPAAPNSSWSVPVSMTIQCATLPDVYSFNATTDQSGHFTIDTWTIPGTSVCNLRLKNMHTLRNLKANVTLAPDGNAVNFGTLLEGDANNNNYVDLVDFSILATAFDSGSADPEFDARTDFNENDWIELADFSLLVTNYDKNGDIVAAGAANIAAASDASESQPMTMFLKPAYYSATRDDIFALDIRLDPKAQIFNSAAAYLHFDPALLEVVDASGTPVVSITPGADLPLVLSNTVDNATGDIRLVSGIAGDPPTVPTAEFSLGTFYFRAKTGDMNLSSVSFLVQQYPPRSGVAYQGYYLPLDVLGAQLRIADTRAMLPMFWIGATNVTK